MPSPFPAVVPCHIKTKEKLRKNRFGVEVEERKI